jgi:carboxypeptidase Taq
MTVNEKFVDFKEYLKGIFLFESVANLLNWDQQVMMPKGAANNRAEVNSAVQMYAFEQFTSDKTADYLDYFLQREISEQLSFEENAMIKVTKEELDKYKVIPKELFARRVKATSLGHHVWEEAREKSEFSIFEDALKELVDISIETAGIYREKLYPETENLYDTLIEQFESGMTSQKLKQIKGVLQPKLTELIKELNDGSTPDDIIFRKNFDISKQIELSKLISKRMGYDYHRGLLEVSVHPFTNKISPDDVRITTRFFEDNIVEGLFGTIHETGHALYEQGLPKAFSWTPLAEGTSLGIHESQSLFWENMIGKSLSFWKNIKPDLDKIFPGAFNEDVFEIYRAANICKPGFIRIESDEVTYSLHILLRFELENALINGQITVSELPEIWNQKMNEYLGVTPDNDAQGVLQDVHWSEGIFGYFPSYMLGKLYAAQMYKTMENEFSIPELIETGEWLKIREWLKTNVHQMGSIYKPNELIRRITGEELDPKYFIDYIEKKFKDIYKI